MKKSLVVVLDGCAKEYITPQTMPNLSERWNKNSNFYKTVQGAVPTVTNVNHATILSGSFPQNHKVVGNYFYDRSTGKEGFIENSDFMKADTIFRYCKKHNKKSALLTVKGKVLTVFGRDADMGLSVQHPDAAVLEKLELPPPPTVQSLKSTDWLFQACYAYMQKEDPDFVYCTTNDYCMHHYAPGTAQAVQQLKTIDSWIQKIVDLDPARQIFVTADHGMNQKTKLYNIQRILDSAGFHTVCIPPLKDRYIENHIYQEGGALYLYLKDAGEKDAVLSYLLKTEGIADVMQNSKAATQFFLPEEGIGDFVLFAGDGCAFGEVESCFLETDSVRTHGSLYEREVPLIALNPPLPAERYHYSKDIIPSILP